MGLGGKNYFPYDLKKISKGKTDFLHDMSLIMETPFGDTYTTAFAKKLIEKEDLGKDDITDVLTVCYTSTDYIGHRFGPSSFEMADAILRLDREIGDLLTYLVDSILLHLMVSRKYLVSSRVTVSRQGISNRSKLCIFSGAILRCCMERVTGLKVIPKGRCF